MRDVTPADLRRLLRYDAETGGLTWLPRSSADVPSGKAKEALRWNSRYAGRSAFTAPNNGGYLSGAVFKRPLLAHVVGWTIHYGAWPRGVLDHIDGDRLNNRISNLRDVSVAENARNVRLPITNSSGRIGVSYNRRDKLWTAYIGVRGRNRVLGNFKRFDDAVSARSDAEKTLDYHDNHGRT